MTAWTIDLTLGDDVVRTITSEDHADPNDTALVLDGLTVTWQLPDDQLFPTQPEPEVARVQLLAAGADAIPTLNVNDLVTLIARPGIPATGPPFIDFHGRIADVRATPIRRGPGDVRLLVDLQCVDSTVDDLGVQFSGLSAWQYIEGTPDSELWWLQILESLGHAGIVEEWGSSALTVPGVPPTKAILVVGDERGNIPPLGELFDWIYSQCNAAPADGPARFKRVIRVAKYGGGRTATITDADDAPAIVLPGRWVVDDNGQLAITFPAGAGVIDACAVHQGIEWYRNTLPPERLRVTGLTTSPEGGYQAGVDLVVGNADGRETLLESNILVDPERAPGSTLEPFAAMYLPDEDDLVWSIDSLVWEPTEADLVALPVPLSLHKGEVLNQPFVIAGIPDHLNLAGHGALYAGTFVGCQVSIERRRVVVQPRISHRLPRNVPGATDATTKSPTWDDVATWFPGKAWTAVRSDISWHDARLAGRPA